MWWPSVNVHPGTVYPDASFDVLGVPVVPGTNTLTATDASTAKRGTDPVGPNRLYKEWLKCLGREERKCND